MNQKMKRRGALLLIVVVGLCLVYLAIILFVPAPKGSCADGMHPRSMAIIRNGSGSNIRFEKVIVDDEIVWEEPELTIMSKKDVETPWLDKRVASFWIDFCAPDKFVELKIATLNDMEERDTVSCALDNRLRPCLFEVGYQKGRLVCSPCTRQ